MPVTAVPSDPRTARLVAAYETLGRASLPALMALYDEHARFKDPFNDVGGRMAIERIFGHMFDALVEPRFVVVSAVTEGDEAFLSWDFHFRRRAGAAPWVIHGATRLRFTAEGRVVLHRDYWDAAEELYARLPVLGALMRWIRARLATPQGR